MGDMVCAVCKATKQRKEFKRLATLVQTRAWLRNPLASKRITYTGKECNECHKQTKRKDKDITPNELHRRLINAGMNPLLVEARVTKRRAQGSKKKSISAQRTMSAYWQAKKSNNEER